MIYQLIKIMRNINKVIVTGGLGFIGSNLIELLLKKNFYVINLDKVSYSSNFYNVKDFENNKNYKFIKSDILNKTKLFDILIKEKPVALFNLAAESHVDRSIDSPYPFIKNNILGVFNLLEVVKNYYKIYKRFKLIHISTDEVYGDMDDIGLLAEANEIFNLKGSSYYSSSKAASDLLVEAAGRTFGLPYLITRTCNNYGDHQNEEKFIPKIMKSIANDLTIPVYGDGKQIREWIDVEDNTQILYNLMLSEEQGGVYNIGSGERYENIEIVNMIGEMLGKKPKFKFVADRLGHDRRYAVDSSKVRGLYPEWINLSFKEFLLEQVYTLKN